VLQYVVAAVGWDVRVWNRTTRLVCKELVGHSAPVLCMECAGATVLTGSQDRTAKIWTFHSEDAEHTLTGHTGPVAAVAMHCTHAATLAHEIRIWSMVCGRNVAYAAACRADAISTYMHARRRPRGRACMRSTWMHRSWRSRAYCWAPA
jgi:WD40 repeat protein